MHDILCFYDTKPHLIVNKMFHVLMICALLPSAKLASERHVGVSSLPEGREDNDLDSSTVSVVVELMANLSSFWEKTCQY